MWRPTSHLLAGRGGWDKFRPWARDCAFRPPHSSTHSGFWLSTFNLLYSDSHCRRVERVYLDISKKNSRSSRCVYRQQRLKLHGRAVGFWRIVRGLQAGWTEQMACRSSCLEQAIVFGEDSIDCPTWMSKLRLKEMPHLGGAVRIAARADGLVSRVRIERPAGIHLRIRGSLASKGRRRP